MMSSFGMGSLRSLVYFLTLIGLLLGNHIAIANNNIPLPSEATSIVQSDVPVNEAF
ncbi:MAG: hypothetical protein HRT74_13345, partial [Flavobacteriales bacterium]|nr:hypothetical protein [Flavobacteriales bacterium]